MRPVIDYGGPAFPSEPMHMGGGAGAVQYTGMTLRDWFASQALASPEVWKPAPDWEIISYFGKGASGIRSEQIAACRAYRIADAMLASRN